MVIQNRPIHQRGIGVFSSVRSSSQTWPVVFSGWPSWPIRTLCFDWDHNSRPQPTMDRTVISATYQFQKPLVKSDMFRLRSILQVGGIVRERQRCGLGEVVFLAQVGPGQDAGEGG